MQVRPITDGVRLNPARRWIVYGVGAGLWLSGVLWLIYHYYMVQQTDFGPSPHPLEYWWRAAHGLFGFASLWTFGMLWGVHIVRGWRTQQKRVSAIALFAILMWLIASGYLLYYLSSDVAISYVAIAHWVVGLALPALFLLHRPRLKPGK